jgi:hypothetical protein
MDLTRAIFFAVQAPMSIEFLKGQSPVIYELVINQKTETPANLPVPLRPDVARSI